MKVSEHISFKREGVADLRRNGKKALLLFLGAQTEVVSKFSFCSSFFGFALICIEMQ